MANSSAKRQDIIITEGGSDYIKPLVKTYTKAFSNDPVFRYIMQSSFDTHLDTVFQALVKLAHVNGARLTVVNTTSLPTTDASTGEISGQCCGIMLPPGANLASLWKFIALGPAFLKLISAVGPVGLKKALFEMPGHIETVQNSPEAKKILGDKKDFFYLNIVGTAPDAQGKGLASALIRHYQEIARQAGKPIWLEASNQNCRRLYEKMGFKVAGEWQLGAGVVGTNGLAVEGEKGENVGVTEWGMLWSPNF